MALVGPIVDAKNSPGCQGIIFAGHLDDLRDCEARPWAAEIRLGTVEAKRWAILVTSARCGHGRPDEMARSGHRPGVPTAICTFEFLSGS